MDLEQAMTIDGIVTDLVPDVDEFAVVSSFFHFTEGLKSAKGIQEKDSVFFKPFIGIAKIFDHGGSILEDPVAEIHGEYQINRIIPDLHNIFTQGLSVSFAQGTESVVYKINFTFDILYRIFIELVFVGAAGLGWFFLFVFRGSSHQ